MMVESRKYTAIKTVGDGTRNTSVGEQSENPHASQRRHV